MADVSSYRIEVAADPANPGYYRWTVFQEGQRLDLPGYAYASAWSAEEAARTALEWHLILKPLRSQPDMSGWPNLNPANPPSAERVRPGVIEPRRAFASRRAAARPRQT